MIDQLKSKNITSLYTNLTSEQAFSQFGIESTLNHVSSLMDSWIALKTIEGNGERNRALYILKSRGMPHSNQVREFVLSDDGIQLLDVYIGSEGVLYTAARRIYRKRRGAVWLSGVWTDDKRPGGQTGTGTGDHKKTARP
ncbi:MAG: hypothetical protein NTW33_00405 [Methanoregula sp.]|nr:hypothetical protein [Methanoregula sp.]